jgi:hypothetical protein
VHQFLSVTLGCLQHVGACVWILGLLGMCNSATKVYLTFIFHLRNIGNIPPRCTTSYLCVVCMYYNSICVYVCLLRLCRVGRHLPGVALLLAAAMLLYLHHSMINSWSAYTGHAALQGGSSPAWCRAAAG